MKWISGILAAGPQFYLAWLLLQVWIDPASIENGAWVRLGVGLMALEFILVHSGVFIASLACAKISTIKKLVSFTGLALFYSAFAWAFSTSLGGMSLLKVYGFVMAGRLSFILSGVDEAAQKRAIGMSALSVLIYLLMIFASVLFSWPEMGLTFEMVQKFYPDHGGGLWEQEPHRAIGAAVVYFALMGFFELITPRAAQSNQSATSNGHKPLK